MKLRNRQIFLIKNKKITPLTISGVKKKGVFAKKEYLFFKNSNKEIKVSEIGKTLFFCLRNTI